MMDWFTQAMMMMQRQEQAQRQSEQARYGALAGRLATRLSPAEEARFQQRMALLGVTDVDHPQSFYDYRGWYLKNRQTGHASGEHFTDEFKLPGHLTFSDEAAQALLRRRPEAAALLQGVPTGKWDDTGFTAGSGQLSSPRDVQRFYEENPDSTLRRP